MSANNSTPSPISGFRLGEEGSDFGADLDLSFDGAEDILRAWRRGMLPDPDLTVSEWADQHRWLSSRASAEPGRYRTARTPYLREIMDALSPRHPAQRITFLKAAQVGATEEGNNWIGFRQRLGAVIGGFDAAQMHRHLRGFRASRAHVNTLIAGAGETITARARWLVRNNGYAANTVEAFASTVVGEGKKPDHSFSKTSQSIAISSLTI
jgi:Phage terminase large subunit gpA, ATPase domain/Phage portal protein, lambda family